MSNYGLRLNYLYLCTNSNRRQRNDRLSLRFVYCSRTTRDLGKDGFRHVVCGAHRGENNPHVSPLRLHHRVAHDRQSSSAQVLEQFDGNSIIEISTDRTLVHMQEPLLEGPDLFTGAAPWIHEVTVVTSSRKAVSPLIDTLLHRLGPGHSRSQRGVVRGEHRATLPLEHSHDDEW